MHNIDRYAIQETDVHFTTELRKILPKISEFGKKFVGSMPKEGSLTPFESGKHKVSIYKILATEENVVSPMYGIHGKEFFEKIPLKTYRKNRCFC